MRDKQVNKDLFREPYTFNRGIVRTGHGEMVEEITKDGLSIRITKRLEGIEEDAIFNLNKSMGVTDRTTKLPLIDKRAHESYLKKSDKHGPTTNEWATIHVDKSGFSELEGSRGPLENMP